MPLFYLLFLNVALPRPHFCSAGTQKTTINYATLLRNCLLCTGNQLRWFCDSKTVVDFICDYLSESWSSCVLEVSDKLSIVVSYSVHYEFRSWIVIIETWMQRLPGDAYTGTAQCLVGFLEWRCTSVSTLNECHVSNRSKHVPSHRVRIKYIC